MSDLRRADRTCELQSECQKHSLATGLLPQSIDEQLCQVFVAYRAWKASYE